MSKVAGNDWEAHLKSQCDDFVLLIKVSALSNEQLCAIFLL
jgi:hypothetical protein